MPVLLRAEGVADATARGPGCRAAHSACLRTFPLAGVNARLAFMFDELRKFETAAPQGGADLEGDAASRGRGRGAAAPGGGAARRAVNERALTAEKAHAIAASLMRPIRGARDVRALRRAADASDGATDALLPYFPKGARRGECVVEFGTREDEYALRTRDDAADRRFSCERVDALSAATRTTRPRRASGA